MKTTTATAFHGSRRIAAGPLPGVTQEAKSYLARHPTAQILIFHDQTGEQIDLDLRELSSGRPASDRKPGRPKLGVIAREVTLLPRHWEWLANQPGGASVALRKLVEHARIANQGKDQRRRAQDAAYRFLTAIAGNAPGYEEAIRALFANQPRRFARLIQPWAKDIRIHAARLAAAAFAKDAHD